MRQKILNELNLRFIPQFQIDTYYVDFYIPDYNLTIEVDGEYWHNYPDYRKYDIDRDYYIMAKGFNGLRFWEREIKNKISCKNFIIEVINHINNHKNEIKVV